jgi:hypothetical protein
VIGECEQHGRKSSGTAANPGTPGDDGAAIELHGCEPTGPTPAAGRSSGEPPLPLIWAIRSVDIGPGGRVHSPQSRGPARVIAASVGGLADNDMADAERRIVTLCVQFCVYRDSGRRRRASRGTLVVLGRLATQRPRQRGLELRHRRAYSDSASILASRQSRLAFQSVVNAKLPARSVCWLPHADYSRRNVRSAHADRFRVVRRRVR